MRMNTGEIIVIPNKFRLPFSLDVLPVFPGQLSEACGLAPGAEAPRSERTLSERSEFVRTFFPASAHLVWVGRASMVLFTFAGTKVNRLPGRNPGREIVSAEVG